MGCGRGWGEERVHAEYQDEGEGKTDGEEELSG